MNQATLARSLALAACSVMVVALAAQPAGAEAHVSLIAGLGAAGTNPCSYTNPECGKDALRARGGGPTVIAGLRARSRFSTGYLRYGIAGKLLYIQGSDASAQEAGVIGTFGVGQGRLAAEISLGLARVRLHEGKMTDQGLTTTLGFAFGVTLSRGLAAVGRLDLDAMMHGKAGAAFIGGGLELSR